LLTRRYCGLSIKRREDARFLTGKGRYVDDITLPGMLHAAILRSPYAHARIIRIDTSDAERLPGVAAVLTGEEVAAKTKPISATVLAKKTPVFSQYCMAFRKVRFVGEPVVAVAARDMATARDALDLIRVEYEPLKPVVSVDEAMRTDAPLIYEEAGSNIIWHDTFIYGDVDGAFATADLVIREKFNIHRYSSTPLETSACIAEYDPASNFLTLWSNEQAVGRILRSFSETIGIPSNRIRMIVPDVGGGFGLKFGLFPYLVITSLLSMKTARPVKFVENRSEHMMVAQSAGGKFDVQLALSREGIVRGIKIVDIEDEGIFGRIIGLYHILKLTNIVNCYKIPNVYFECYSVVTNKCSVLPNRGVGKPGMCFMIERMMDIAARKLGMSPEEIRFRNFIQPQEFPYRTTTGNLYDSGNYPEALRKLLQLLEIDKLRVEQRKLREQGKYIGIGFSIGVEPAATNLAYASLSESGQPDISGSSEGARVTIDPTGKVIVSIGGPSNGQGHETSVSQIVADVLGVTPDDVSLLSGVDSLTHPITGSSGRYANRFAAVEVGALVNAARKVREKVLLIAGSLLDARPEDLEIADGIVYVKNEPERKKSIKEIAIMAYSDVLRLPKDVEPGLTATSYYIHPSADLPDERRRMSIQMTFAYSTHAAVVEVDIETGLIKVLRYIVVADCGNMINLAIVDGQMHGATAHGISAALHERFIFNEEGQPLTITFADYGATTAMEVPNIEVYHMITPSPFTPLGTKGVGEGGAIPSLAAIANAVEDALEPFGVKITDLPITPEKILRLLKRIS